MEQKINPRQEIFEKLVADGFTPLRTIIEYKHLEYDLTPEDIKKVMGNIEYNVLTWIKYLKHRNEHISRQSGRDN